MSNLTQEIIALEQNRQAIVGAVNAKGGELAENAPLNAIAQAIEALPSGGGAETYEGEVTLVSGLYDFTIEHNKGKVPKFVLIQRYPNAAVNATKAFFATRFDESYLVDNMSFVAYVGYSTGTESITFLTSTIVEELTDYRHTVIDSNKVIARCTAAARRWGTGTYKYTLIF